MIRDTPPSLGSQDLEQKLLAPEVAKAAEVEASAAKAAHVESTVTSTVTRPPTVVVITPDGKRERQALSYSE